MKPNALFLAATAAAALAACSTQSHVALNTAPAPAAVAVMGAPAATLNATDRAFALSAATSNLFEIGASQLAMKRTGETDVLSLANMIDQHHTVAFNELAAIMRARGMTVPTDLNPDKQTIMNKLGTVTGGEFDQRFVLEVGLNAHRTDIAVFQQQIPKLADPELKAWAMRTLPLMQQHLAMAQQVAAKVG